MKNIAIYQAKKLTDKYVIYKYNDDYYKLTYFNYPIKNEGFEDKSSRLKYNRDVNDEKLDSNISRARSKIFELALCNEFDYFITVTLNKQKYDRYNLANFIKDLGQDFRNQRRKYQADIQYLLIPEPHKDGAWHMHGLIKGMPDEELKLFTLQDDIPKELLDMIKNGHVLYNWLNYAEKFGWNVLEAVKTQEAISKYITKYISKALSVDLRARKNKKLYYATRGLKRAEKVKEGYLTSSQLVQIPFSFQNDYVKQKDLSGLEYLKLTNQVL